jgi:acyl-CoA thioester hydrolase
MSEFVLPVRVYLEDTDAQGVVYNASYFRFLERARTEWLRAKGVEHNALKDRGGLIFVLAGIEAKFNAPARLDDMLYVAADVSELGGARVVFQQGIRRSRADGELLCRATAEVACVDASRQRPRRLPANLIDEWSRS